MKLPTPAFRPTLVILLLGLMTAFAPFSIDTYLAGFSGIAASLQCKTSDVQLSLSSFFLGLAIGQMFYGPISDRIGRKIPLLAGICIFSVTSLIAIYSPNISTFVTLRFFQAIGGCAGMITGRTILRDAFTPQEVARALSLLMVVQSLGPIFAPILGGFILSFTSWHGIFIFLVILGMFTFVATLYCIPETLPVEQRRSESFGNVPKVFFQLVCTRDFIFPTIACSVGLSSMFIFISGSPYVFMEIYGVGQQQYGWLFGLNAVGMITVSWLNRYLLKKFSPTQILTGALLAAILLSGVTLLLSNTNHLIFLIIPLFACLSLVPMIGANSVAIAMVAAGAHAGSGSSLIGVMQFGFAAVASGLVSFFHNGTAYPMTSMIFIVSIVAGFVFLSWRQQAVPCVSSRAA